VLQSSDLSIGLDIVEISRVRRLVRRTPLFLKRVFTSGEISYCRSKKNPWQHFAVRFAAKEAVWKALEGGVMSLKDISVSRDPNGKPMVLLKGRPARGFKLSLSHSERYALAVAIRA
jgi:holo-[acyl-carrier protein] synthase